MKTYTDKLKEKVKFVLGSRLDDESQIDAVTDVFYRFISQEIIPLVEKETTKKILKQLKEQGAIDDYE